MNDEVVDLFKELSSHKFTSPYKESNSTRLPDTDTLFSTHRRSLCKPLVVLMDGFSYFIDLHRRQITTDYPLLGFFLPAAGLQSGRLPGPDALNRPQRHLRIVLIADLVDPKSTPCPTPISMQGRASSCWMSIEMRRFAARRVPSLRVSHPSLRAHGMNLIFMTGDGTF
jgi:hypothetical protein